jgi:hypothetical protein
MTEGEAPPPQIPQPPPRHRWRRARIYLWSLLLVLGLWAFAGVYVFRYQPKRLVGRALAQLPYPTAVGHVAWIDPQTVKISDLRIGDFFYADSILVTANLHDLFRYHLDAVTVNGAQLYMAAMTKALAQHPSGSSANIPWTINKLTIRRGTLMIDAGANLSSIPVRLGAVHPIIINYIKLQKPDETPAMTRERMVELENIHFASPFDPLAPVLSLPLTRIRFTYAELWHHQIRSVELIHPNLFLGQDLFWFTDEIKKQRATLPAAGPAAPWHIGHFAVQYGQLSINAFGQPRVQFPFFFDTEVDDIRLDQLDKISAKSVIAIRHLTKDYPDYKIRIVNLHGKLEFSIPPTDAKANNVVPTINIDELSWNDIPVTNVWSSVTFDPTGIYGRLGGNCEKGFMEGNFEVYYTKGFTWNAGFFANQVDCQPIAEKLAGKYMKLTGSLDGKIDVQGRSTEILKCAGRLALAHPGTLQIQSIDDLINRIPADTTALKRDAMKIALKALQFYPYQTGVVQLDYTPGNGEGTLKLEGKYGKRDFGVYWHPFETSKVARNDETH